MALLQEAGESHCSTVLLLLGITRHQSIFIQVDHLVIEVIAAAPVIVAPAIRVAVIYIVWVQLISSHLVHQLAAPLLRHQLLVLVRREPVPVRQLEIENI